MSIGQRIKIIRKHYNIKMEDLANEFNCSQSNISQLENDKSHPSFDFLIKFISKFNKVSVEWLMTGEGNMIKDNIIYSTVVADSKAFKEPKAEYISKNNIMSEVSELNMKIHEQEEIIKRILVMKDQMEVIRNLSQTIKNLSNK